ncbi:hypothetical protein JIN85_04675 [Luteolibacter pohnpeiensis]|uniref:Uncharacterized protein n=1 Tax=Luteolibacter pohnpeiensis TaxID=454153 RepID=A0A934S1W8_9BACT|nr:hypothetical protein [Luteolibacter pohnpeiensis]MBK1881695.1 hypothetical protein [Luteolibacter pohnpeiensis]
MELLSKVLILFIVSVFPVKAVERLVPEQAFRINNSILIRLIDVREKPIWDFQTLVRIRGRIFRARHYDGFGHKDLKGRPVMWIFLDSLEEYDNYGNARAIDVVIDSEFDALKVLDVAIIDSGADISEFLKNPEKDFKALEIITIPPALTEK